MALDVVFLVDVGLDDGHMGNARITAEQVQDGHAAAADADLEQMGHGCPPLV